MEPSNLIGVFYFEAGEEILFIYYFTISPSSTIKSESIYEKEFIYYLFLSALRISFAQQVEWNSSRILLRYKN